MPDIDGTLAATQVWRRQALWSQAAERVKRRITRGRRLVAALTAVAAVAGTAAAMLATAAPAAGRVLAIVAGASLLLVPVAGRWSSRGAVATWTRLRAVSEASKAELYRYLARAAPYADADADAVLLRRYDLLMADAGDLVGQTLDDPPADRPLPAVTDVPSYLVERVQRQVDGYYLPAARRSGRSAARIGRTATVLTVLVALLSAVTGVLGDGLGLTAWVGVATVVTTALVGYGAAQRYEQQHLEYARTADQLTRLRLTRAAGHGWSDDDALVAEAERIIAHSNAAWMAKMIEEDGAAQQ
ncbi:DUF4231 domain-containing protein [Micromonospora rifamycinica]|uniref:SMODS and SLOG-associating 2TM effector domain-containing protein n=1 Tax=Micromonospora rifamycinica TaxID=291594 RepID=A0A120F8K8_9ACTN|nr:DUF4231 domain-containing protein [Micromonospora rifamycinica]KWV31986.1 hypothetical protein AWV63_14715 [Micromonospora rifamycinica]SCG42555.1 Protein of unknown function [Micromonospora rifamycinica]